jgi:NADH:ubiquinone reductase (non-electrogenic)
MSFCKLMRPVASRPFSTRPAQKLTSSPITRARIATSSSPILRRTFTQSAFRSSPEVILSPAPQPPKRGKFRKFLSFTYRFTQLSLIGGFGYVAYGIWASRNPADQFDPDPSKKTLVVLGTGWGSVALLKKLDTENYNVIVISPRNYFLFTPLLPSCTTGTIEHRSIMEPIRNFLRHKKATVKYYEAEATKIDYEKRMVYVTDEAVIKGDKVTTEVPFDMLVIGVGAENATFG